MKIRFFTIDEQEDQIATFDDMISNPFSLNDRVALSVNELTLYDLDGFKESLKGDLRKRHEQFAEKYNNVILKLLDEKKFIEVNPLYRKNEIIIEYFCKIESKI